MAAPAPRIDGRMIVGGMAHDFDYARLELLRMLAEHPHARVSVSDSFEDHKILDSCGFLITYTCNLQPTDDAALGMRAFVARGGRWLALHATNSLLAWTSVGVKAREGSAVFLETLGSQFVAHPPIDSFRVLNVAPEDPLVAGIEDFDTTDELYLSRLQPDIEVLLETRFSGQAPGFFEADWADDSARPVLYRRLVGAGSVVYFTLGHCRGHYDAPHRTPYYPSVERCSWETPAYREILRRAVCWAVRGGAHHPKREDHDDRQT